MAIGDGFPNSRERRQGRLGLAVLGLGVLAASVFAVPAPAKAFHRHHYVCPPVHRHHVYRAPVYRSYNYCPPVYRHYRPHTYHYHYRAPAYCPPVIRHHYSAPYCYPGYGYSYYYNYGYGYPIGFRTSLPFVGGIWPIGGFGGGAVPNTGSINLLSQASDLGAEYSSSSRAVPPARSLANPPVYDYRRDDLARRDLQDGRSVGVPGAGQGIFAPNDTQNVIELVSRVAESVREARIAREARGTASGSGVSGAAPRRPLLAAAARALSGTAAGGQAARELPLAPRAAAQELDAEGSGVEEAAAGGEAAGGEAAGGEAAERALPPIPARPPVFQQQAPGARVPGTRDLRRVSPPQPAATPDQPELPEPSVDRPAFSTRDDLPQASSDAARRRSAKYIQQGDQLFARGRYLEAMSVYQRAAASTPDAAQPLIRQGLAYLAAKRYERAADVIRRGLRIEPDYASSGFRLRQLYGGDIVAKNEHLDALAEAASADPGNADLPLLAAIFLHYDGQAERAAPFFAASQQRSDESSEFVAMFRSESVTGM